MRLLLAFLFILSPIAFAQEIPEGTAPPVNQAAAAPFLRDGTAMQPLLASQPAWHALEQMNAAERANAVLGIELASNADGAALSLARSVEELWNGGQHDAALGKMIDLAALQTQTTFAVGVSYRAPVTSHLLKSAGATVRVGTRDSLAQTFLARDSATGNLFAVLSGRGDGGTNWWTVNISTDQGQTWQETYRWGTSYSLPTLGAAIGGGSLYVVYTGGDIDTRELRQRRFTVSTGASQSYSDGSAYLTVLTLPVGEKITIAAVGSNSDYFNNRLYVAAITSTGRLPAYWNMLDTTHWHAFPTDTIKNALRGLSCAYNRTATPYYYWLSYIDNNDTLHIDGLEDAMYLSAFKMRTYGGDFSSVGAHQDTIFCAFEYTGTRRMIRYEITYGLASPSFLYGFIGDTTLNSEKPTVALGGNGGMGVIGRFYTPTREGRFQWRKYARGTWSASQVYTVHEPYFHQAAIVYMGDGTYGILYLSWSTPEIQAAYFTTTAIPTEVEETPGEMPAGFALGQNYPNPFNPSTTIAYNLPNDVKVSLKVYDLLGREVATLVEGQQGAGPHIATWDASQMATGIYLYRLQADRFSEVKKMVLMK